MLHAWGTLVYIYMIIYRDRDSGTTCTRTPGHTDGLVAPLQAQGLCSLLCGCDRVAHIPQAHRPGRHVLGRFQPPATEVLGVGLLELGPRGPVSGNGRTWPKPNGSGRREICATGSGKRV